ncbi:hypothetical protein [Corynebacterium alimapuense]|uniref:hypothetical protein n=1 Tax=Corynebacterium alimapuense TaxID=1576874 RepID=UPI000F80BE52|nr:hypothetical protein [Corynebacterium alimapuense]
MTTAKTTQYSTQSGPSTMRKLESTCSTLSLPTLPPKNNGCRAYGGNYAFTSVDAQGRSYAKIDCTTKAQIG